MSKKLLLPNRYKKIDWFILLPSTIFGIILCYKEFGADWIHAKVFAIANEGPLESYKYFSFTYANITNTVVGGLFIIGAMLVSFSKEKNEDEFITELRLSSLLWAVYLIAHCFFICVWHSLFRCYGIQYVYRAYNIHCEV